jgi:predicted porin
MTRPTHPSFRTILCKATLLTLALMGATAAQAQSNVNISGTIDIAAFRGFDGIAINKGTQVGSLQRSDLTFSGKEDLGDGLATTFKLSTRFEPDTGSTENSNKPFWYGESTVGLKGSFGHIRLGRAMEAVTANDWAFDPWDNFDRLASPAWQFWHYNYAVDRHGSTTGGSEYFRLNNGVFFDSATYSGFSLSANTSFEKNTTANVGTGKPYGLAFKYGGNGFNATLSLGRNADGDTVKFLGLKQNFGALTVMGAYDISTYQGTTVNSTAHATTVGATYQLSTVLLQASVGRLSYDGTHSEMEAVGARYPLSKRTYVYGDLSHIKFYQQEGHVGYGVGINHSF